MVKGNFVSHNSYWFLPILSTYFDQSRANLEGKVRQPEPRPKAEKKVPLSSASSSRGASSSAQATGRSLLPFFHCFFP